MIIIKAVESEDLNVIHGSREVFSITLFAIAKSIMMKR
jgi:hypothetical protein